MELINTFLSNAVNVWLLIAFCLGVPILLANVSHETKMKIVNFMRWFVFVALIFVSILVLLGGSK